MAMFPDLAHQVDDVYWMGNEREGYLVSVRWSIQGTHRGAGIYGTPTGRDVLMWGIDQLTSRTARSASSGCCSTSSP